MSVSPTNPDLADTILAQMTPEERAGAVAYVADAPLVPGARLELPGVTLEASVESDVAFIDRQPTANWGHPARYLLIGRTSGDVRSVETRLPPFTSGPAPAWRVIYQAPSVPDAAVAVPR